MLVATVRTVVVTDTSILINFLHTGHLWLLGRLPGFRFVIPDEVISEIAQADQQQIIAEAMAAGHVQRESISSPDELALFAELRQVRGGRILLPHACREARLDRGMRREESLSKRSHEAPWSGSHPEYARYLRVEHSRWIDHCRGRG